MRIIQSLICLLLTFSICCSSKVSNRPENSRLSSAASPAAESTPDQNVIVSIPVGPSGVAVENVDIDEAEPWGPSALRIAPDGSFIVVDTATNRILRFRSDGSQVSAIQVRDAVGITDVAVDDDNIYTLDTAAVSPAVLRVSNEGAVLEKRVVPSAVVKRGLSGISMALDGAVLLEFNGGTSRRRLNNLNSHSAALTLSRSLNGQDYGIRVPPLTQQVSEGGRATISFKGQTFAEIVVDNLIATAKALSVNQANGDLYVQVEEIIATPKVDVDETIRWYHADGQLAGVARVPIHDSLYIPQNVDIKDGVPYQARIEPKRNKFEVVKLDFQSQIDPILPKTLFSPSNFTPASNCDLHRAQIVATAQTYINNKTTLSLANLNGDGCDGRGKPRYLKDTSGEYPSVAYDWGGGDTVKSYAKHMEENHAAGDIDNVHLNATKGVEECSSGVDCSGFVTRCWGFRDESWKYDTKDLPKISTEINILELLQGDILNLPNHHVALFSSYTYDTLGDNALEVWESTTTGSVDRVWNGGRSWRRFLGYTARRYKKIC